MKKRPTLFLGPTISLGKIYSFLAGYSIGFATVNKLNVGFLGYFQDFIEAHYSPVKEEYHTQHWSELLLEYYSEEEAVQTFWSEITLFWEIVGIGNDSLIYQLGGDPSWAVHALNERGIEQIKKDRQLKVKPKSDKIQDF